MRILHAAGEEEWRIDICSMASPAARLLAPSTDDPAPAFAMSDKSGRHVRIYACAQRDTLLNQLHLSASTKLGIKVTGMACAAHGGGEQSYSMVSRHDNQT